MGGGGLARRNQEGGGIHFQPAYTDATASTLDRSVTRPFLQHGEQCPHFILSVYGFLLQSATGRELHFMPHLCLDEQTSSCICQNLSRRSASLNLVVSWLMHASSVDNTHGIPDK